MPDAPIDPKAGERVETPNLDKVIEHVCLGANGAAAYIARAELAALKITARRVEALEGLLQSAVEMLRKHEHAVTFEPDNPDSTGGSYEVCPECGQALGGGHYSSCAYAALLARLDAALQAAREGTDA